MNKKNLVLPIFLFFVAKVAVDVCVTWTPYFPSFSWVNEQQVSLDSSPSALGVDVVDPMMSDVVAKQEVVKVRSFFFSEDTQPPP